MALTTDGHPTHPALPTAGGPATSPTTRCELESQPTRRGPDPGWPPSVSGLSSRGRRRPTGPGRRSARLGGEHGKHSARGGEGLEGALVGHSPFGKRHRAKGSFFVELCTNRSNHKRDLAFAQVLVHRKRHHLVGHRPGERYISHDDSRMS